MKTKIMIAIVAITMAFTSCKKAEKGEAGTPGKDGNANVKSIKLNANSWTWDNTNKWNYASWSNVSILTSDVVNGGAVMVYEGNSSTGNWLAMPYSLSLGNSNNQTYNANFEYVAGSISVYKSLSDGLSFTESASQFKLVCIPQSLIKHNPNVDLTDYNQVKEAFDLD